MRVNGRITAEGLEPGAGTGNGVKDFPKRSTERAGVELAYWK
jgi:hypothetical protein